MAEFDVVIRDGMVVDGTRMPRFRGDIGIKDGRIAKIGRLRPTDGAANPRRLGTDCRARLRRSAYPLRRATVLGPLLLDLQLARRHFGRDRQLRVRFRPVRPEGRERAMLTMTRVEAIPYASMKAGMPWDWTTFPEFLDSIARRPKAVNILPYVPVSPLLTWVMGLEAA